MSPTVSVEATPLQGVVILHREPFEDHRGSLDRLFDVDSVNELVSGFKVAQVNHTVTVGRGTVRGLHYQGPPQADAKIVTCLRGRVFDVVVDLRARSATLLNWHAVELNGKERSSVLIPSGFAHGFQLLSDSCELLYVHSERYRENAEGGIHPEDPALSISWPEAISQMSTRDREHPILDPDWPGVAQ